MPSPRLGRPAIMAELAARRELRASTPIFHQWARVAIEEARGDRDRALAVAMRLFHDPGERDPVWYDLIQGGILEALGEIESDNDPTIRRIMARIALRSQR